MYQPPVTLGHFTLLGFGEQLTKRSTWRRLPLFIVSRDSISANNISLMLQLLLTSVVSGYITFSLILYIM